MGIKRSVFLSLIQRRKRFLKMLINEYSRSIWMVKNGQIAKSAVFASLFALTWLFLNFFENGFLQWIRLETTDCLIPISTCFEKMKKSLLLVVLSATKSRLRRSIFILEKIGLSKCCLEYKNTVVFTSCNGDFQNSWKSITLTVHIVCQKITKFCSLMQCLILTTRRR